jgi:hypothetical protein
MSINDISRQPPGSDLADSFRAARDRVHNRPASDAPKDEFTCPPLPHAFYVLLVGRGMPETLTTGEQHAWLYRHLVTFDDTARQLRSAKEILDPLESLREPEGASVTIFCPNPDFGGAAQAIEVCDEWTDYSPKRFEGDSLADALELAAKAKAKG